MVVGKITFCSIQDIYDYMDRNLEEQIHSDLCDNFESQLEITKGSDANITDILCSFQSASRNMNQRVLQYQEILRFLIQERQTIQHLLFYEKQQNLNFMNARQEVMKHLSRQLESDLKNPEIQTGIIRAIPYARILRYWKINEVKDIILLFQQLPSSLCTQASLNCLKSLFQNNEDHSSDAMIEYENLFLEGFRQWSNISCKSSTADVNWNMSLLVNETHDVHAQSSSNNNVFHQRQPIDGEFRSSFGESALDIGNISPTGSECSPLEMSCDQTSDNIVDTVAPTEIKSDETSAHLPSFLRPPWRYIALKSVREVMESSTTPEYQCLHHGQRQLTQNSPSQPISFSAINFTHTIPLTKSNESFPSSKVGYTTTGSFSDKNMLNTPSSAFSSSPFVRKQINWGKVHSAGSDIYCTMQQSLSSPVVSAVNTTATIDSAEEVTNTNSHHVDSQQSTIFHQNSLFSLLAKNSNTKDIIVNAKDNDHVENNVDSQSSHNSGSMSEHQKLRFLNSVLENARKRR